MKVRGLFKKTLRWTGSFLFVGGMALGVAQAWADGTASSEEPSSMTRAINIDEAGVGNFYYVVGSIDNSDAPGSLINLQGEGLLKLDPNWALDVVFPDVVLQKPLGKGPAALGPLGGGPRWVFERFRSPDGGSSGVFSLEAQAFGWATPDNRFQEDGSYSLQALGAFRLGRIYLQGNYGYNGAFDSNFTPNWFAFTALGVALGAHWAIQVEGDFTDTILPNNGGMSSQWTWVPQLGFKTDGWLLEAGLGLPAGVSDTTTDFVVEKELF